MADDPYTEAIQREIEFREGIAKCRAQFGEDYPCREKVTLDLCLKRERAGEDTRFMTAPSMPPDCQPHNDVYQRALKKYQLGKNRDDLGDIRKLIERAKQHADTAQSLVQRALEAWSLSEQAVKSAAWGEAQLRKAEPSAQDALEYCEHAPTLAELEAAKQKVLDATNDSRDLLKRMGGFTEEACKIAGMVAPDDRDPYRGNRAQKVDGLLGYAREHTTLIGTLADRASTQTKAMLDMEERRRDAWRKGEFARDALAPVLLSSKYAADEITRLGAKVDTYPPLLDQAEEEARQANVLKAEALERLERQHHWSTSRMFSEHEQQTLAKDVGVLLEACKGILLPNVESARKVVAESRKRIQGGLETVRRTLVSAQERDGSLTRVCGPLAESASESIRLAEGGADEARRAQQDAQKLLAGAEKCGGKVAQGEADDDGGFAHQGTQVGDNSLDPGPLGDDDVIGQGGFAHEGTNVGPGREPSNALSPTLGPEGTEGEPPIRRSTSDETVTYFDRPWLPRSWQTDGNQKQTRAEIYQAASRLGWAAALAEYAPTTADNLIIDHLNATAGHLQRANQASFAPHKAWPDWQHRQAVYGQWIRHLTQGSTASKDYFRKGLDGLIRSESRALREQLLTQTPRQAGGLSNCDSAIFVIGYDLAHAAQLQSIAQDGAKAGKDKAWVRQLLNKASGSATSAGRNIQLIKPTPQQKGCPDYTVLSQELNQVKSRLNLAVEPELHTVWTKGMALAANGGASYDPDDLTGEWTISRDFFSWGGYMKRDTDAPALDPRQSGTVCVRIEARGGIYVGTISRQGVVPVVSDGWTGGDIGRQRLHLFHEGLEYLRLKKVGKNVFEGTIVDTGIPGDMHLTTKQVVIVVYGEAAKLLQKFSPMPKEQFEKTRNEGILMLRLDTGAPSATPDLEAAGRHVFAGIEPLAPPGAKGLREGVGQSQLEGIAVASYTFRFRKSFSFGNVTDTNPGVTIQLLYLGDSKRRGIDKCYTTDTIVLLQDEAFKRHGGEGRFCASTLRNNRKPIDYSLMSRLVWSKGDWVISFYGVDYPNHPGTQFHGQQGQMNYMFHVLDQLAPRLDSLPTATQQGGTRTGQLPVMDRRPAASPASGDMDLLGIQSH